MTNPNGIGRPRIFNDIDRKKRKADEQRRRRASDKGKKWSKDYYQRPEVKKRKKEMSRSQKNRDAIRNWGLKNDFGITIGDYNQMFESQKGLCAICFNIELSGKRLSVDHCHLSGKIRGLLCGHCNRGLGLFRDNVTFLTRAIKYLYGK